MVLLLPPCFADATLITPCAAMPMPPCRHAAIRRHAALDGRKLRDTKHQPSPRRACALAMADSLMLCRDVHTTPRDTSLMPGRLRWRDAYARRRACFCRERPLFAAEPPENQASATIRFVATVDARYAAARHQRWRCAARVHPPRDGGAQRQTAMPRHDAPPQRAAFPRSVFVHETAAAALLI